MRPFTFPYIRHSSIGMVGMLAILLIASLAINVSLIADSLRKGDPAKPTAQRLVTGNGAVKFDEFGQPMWWSAPITVGDKNLTVGMRSSLDSQTMVPMATERSPWPPGFSLVNMQFQILWGSRFVPRSSIKESAVASSRRGIKRSRISLPCP